MKKKSKTNFWDTISHYGYLRHLSRFKKTPQAVFMPVKGDKAEQKGNLKIAFICDEMTWRDYSQYCTALFLHPFKWKKQLKEFKPDLLFCESAWAGIAGSNDCWRGRIYKDKRVAFENRKELFKIVDFCKKEAIPTVFWNKEDPTFFNNDVYDFSDTALKFDYIFTTAEECVARYRRLGGERAEVLQFGVNESFFNVTCSANSGKAIFAGSWFDDMKKRCKTLCNLFDYTVKTGLTLDIYDRDACGGKGKTKFPEKYRERVKPAVAYKDLAGVFKEYEYAVNVNTVTHSKTMFSRRFLQLCACGVKVITNDFMGLETLGGCIEIIKRDKTSGTVILKGKPEKIKERFLTSVLFDRITAVLKNNVKQK